MEKTFELKMFKIGLFGADCKYKLSETDEEGTVTENEFHVKVSRPIHPDLTGLFEKDLRDIVANIIGTTDDISAIELGNSTITPTGIAFAGKNENIGISIFGERQTKFGRVVFKTPRIKYKTSESEVAAKLTVFADKIVNEAHEYLFENKTAEMSVFGE